MTGNVSKKVPNTNINIISRNKDLLEEGAPSSRKSLFYS